MFASCAGLGAKRAPLSLDVSKASRLLLLLLLLGTQFSRTSPGAVDTSDRSVSAPASAQQRRTSETLANFSLDWALFGLCAFAFAGSGWRWQP